MKMLVFLFSLVLGILQSTSCYADIYKATKSYNHAIEKEFQNWIKETISADIFSNKQSPYFGIKTDCADAAIALRIIFSYENKIPFMFKDNNGRVITEKSQVFDTYFDELSRIKALINYLSDNIGSETLANDNTFPIKLDQIKPGDLYITRWRNKKGEFTRHVYIIKEILPTGDLLLLSSTQPRSVRPLLARKGMPLHFFSESPFGFRRFMPRDSQSTSTLLHYSLEQYALRNLGESAFFNHVKDLLKNTEDTLKLNIQRRIENICVALTAREDIVNLAIEFKKENNLKCFSHSLFDEFSTPSRDQNIFNDIERLRAGVKTILFQKLSHELDETTWAGLLYLINPYENNINDNIGLESIKNFCHISIELENNKFIHLNMKSFYERYRKGFISSNPNENIATRWGLSPKTSTCPTY